MFTNEFERRLDACIGFYGLDGNRGGQGYYNATVAYCTRLNLRPTTLVVDHSGGSKRSTSFRVGDRRLKQERFKSVEGFTLFVCPEDAEAHMLQADLECDWSAGEWALLVARSVLTNLDDPRFRDWLRESIAALRPEYGIGYYRRRRLASALYVIGLGFEYPGKPPEEDREELHRLQTWWRHGLRKAVWRQGILRDVYPLHILTKPQLDRLVGKVPLRDWIVKKPRRGLLTELVEGWWLWEVPNEGAEQVRRDLMEAGALFQPPPEDPED